MFGKEILLLAPHPQDEIIGCFGAIARARAAGARVHLLYLTTGLGARARPERRRAEAEKVAERLGLEIRGFGETPAGGLKDHLEEARAAIAAALAASGAELLWSPAYEGGHQDLDLANVLAAGFAGRARVWEFSEYNLAGGRLRNHAFPTPQGRELTVRLGTAAAEAKREALRLYASEWPRLRHIPCDREAFRPLPAHDYERPPHEGPLCYQRLRLRGFRPRAGRGRPEAVQAAIRAAFGAAAEGRRDDAA